MVLAGCGSGADAANKDPLATYQPWEFSQCVNNRPEEDLYVGAGVLDNSYSQAYRITGVDFVTSRNATIVEAVLVPGVQPSGMAKSVVANLKPKWFQNVEGQKVHWPWRKRVAAVGAELQPGESGEIVVRFRQVDPGEWSFDGVRVTYTDGRHDYEHVQPASAVSAKSGC